MRGKKPFLLAPNIIMAGAFLTAVWYFFFQNTQIGDIIRQIMVWGFALILAGTLITYINWSEARRRT